MLILNDSQTCPSCQHIDEKPRKGVSGATFSEHIEKATWICFMGTVDVAFPLQNKRFDDPNIQWFDHPVRQPWRLNKQI